MTQLDLSDYRPQPPAVASETSRAAAQSVKANAHTLRMKVLAFVAQKGAAGATDEEIQEGLGMAANTQRPRRVELVAAGLVGDSGGTRRTRSGRMAVVWTVVS